ncbi:MAG: RNA polymerase sigma factor [Phycisphaerae bacterium]|nr:RNA polymerase sigma factor [Phycisphaerae bacterium]
MIDQDQSGTVSEAAANRVRAEAEFSAHFLRARRVLWLIAAGLIGDRTLADDVVQDAAVIAFQKYDQFTPGTSFTAWMGQVVRHVAMNTARRENRRKSASLDGDTALTGSVLRCTDPGRVELGPRGELPVEHSWFDDQVSRALADVGEVARACLLLRSIESMEYSEISAVLSIPEGTAMSHVHRARRLMRERLMASGWDVATGRRGHA